MTEAMPSRRGRGMKKAATKDRLAVFDEALEKAHCTEKAVRVLASVIADTMAEFYEVPFRVSIDHEDGYVVVRPE